MTLTLIAFAPYLLAFAVPLVPWLATRGYKPRHAKWGAA